MTHPAPSSLSARALPLIACLMLGTALPAAAQSARANIVPADIESASYSGSGELPSGQSALTAKVQILLDRSGVSPGVVDGFRGGMSESAIKAFERMRGLPQDGKLDPLVWALLEEQETGPLTSTYTVTEEDAQGLVDSIPSDYAEKAQMEELGYTSLIEKLAERFHMDDKFLAQLNPGVTIAPGATINVTVPAKPLKKKVSRIFIDKATGRVAAYDAGGRMVADYPATVGSSDTPSPHGTHTVKNVALNPNYTYNPAINFKQGENDKVLTIPPGPNGPVGNVWIGLSQPTYGIHGTPTPSRLFVNESHGCVRLTNWDARELAGMVEQGQTVVEFLSDGVSIADVTAPVAPPEGLESAVAAADPNAAVAGSAGDASVTTLTARRPAPRSAGAAAAATLARALDSRAAEAGIGATPDGAATGAAAIPTTAAAATAGMTTTESAAVPVSETAVGETATTPAATTAATQAAAGTAAPAAPAAAVDPLAAALNSATDGALETQPYVLPGAAGTPATAGGN